MKKFSGIYKQIKPSIVAIASKISSNPEFPDIIGTGFIARSDGIIFTNDHVIRALNKLPRLKGMPEDEWPAYVVYFHWIPDKGMATITMEIKGAGIIKKERPTDGYSYGPEIPDLGFIHVHMRDLAALKIAEKLELEEGDEILLSGFPLGTKALRAPGWLHQLSPTLHSGIVSAILPFPCENPHAILIDTMSHGGSSGSPVFNKSDGAVIGMVYAGLIETKSVEGVSGLLLYQNNTSLTLAISSNIIHSIFKKVDDIEVIRKVDVSKFDTIESLISKRGYEISPPKTPTMKPIDPEDLISKKGS